MPDRISAVIAVPIDDALPVDVQGVALRRHAIDLMKEIAEIDESTVRFKGASDYATLNLGGDYMLSVWQHNLLGVVFIADGKALEGVCGPIIHKEPVARNYSAVSVVRNEFD